MAYQAVGQQAWGAAAGAGAAPGMSDPYYAQYYSAYGNGYGNGYDYSAYYQQQGYPGAAQPPAPGAPPAPPSSPPPPGAEPEKPADAEKPPPPPPGGPPPAPGAASANPTPPAPPPGGPPPAPSSAPAAAAGAAPGGASAAAAAAAAASGGYDSAAYAQWYAQYGYYGYDPQYAQQYWQQQQQQQPQQAYPGYGVAGQPSYPQQPKPGVPPPAPPKGDPPPGTGGKPPGQAAAAGSSRPYSGVIDSYNAQPPPANLYGQQNGHQQHNSRNQRAGLTGTNMTPLGPRPPPGDPPASAVGQQQQQLTPQQHAAAVAARFSRGPVVIRPQMPAARPAATPAYIAVGGAASGTAPAKTGVAAAVAAAAAGAAAAAAATKSGSAAAAAGAGNTQWPPSFTAWVTRCFNAARLRGVPDSRLSEKLMAYLDQVKGEGRLWTTDWDTQAVMLPDGAAGGGGASGADGGALSPAGPQGRKRNRWGTVPAGDSGAGAGAGDYRSAAGGRGYERSQDVDSDEEDYGQYGGQHHRHGAPSPRGGGHQHLSNRKRKKLLALEARQQQQQRGGPATSPYGHAYTTAEEQKRRARAGRFGDGRAAGAGRYGGSESDDVSDDDYDDDDRRFGGGQVVVGTSNNLEKSYFRLTSQPEPSTVRPEPVLARALDRLVRLIASREATYFYSLDQFKGMRQDCTVQHLRNALTVRVYEAHGRSSLEYGDVAEFNQCQARLGHLYAEGVPGCVAEFTGYRLLYETVHAATAGRRHAGSMTKALLHTMRNVPPELVAAPEIRHALKVREVVMNFNYSGFFRLYSTAPHLGRAILDVVVEPLRWAGLNAFVKAADLPVPLSALALILGFGMQPARPERKNQAGAKEEEEGAEDRKAEGGKVTEAAPLPGCRFAHLAGDASPVASEEEAIQRCAQWLADHGAVVVEKGSELVLDTKASRGKMFVPEVTEKIETGDLSVTDFLSRARVAVE